ncbi:MAG: hypothetical protein HY720_11620 [Planctomycetes bacterium]|nr:hypothetical protein [Planctomycetota bacterium]
MPTGPIRRFWQELREWVGESAVLRPERPYAETLSAISEMEPALASASDAELGEHARRVRDAIGGGAGPEARLVEWDALVREVASRRIGLRAHGEQILAAIVLSGRRLVEMPTGEGKTLVAVFPASLSAASGKGVHILTFNDYLARRDAEWMGPIYRALGISVGFVHQETGCRS